LLVNQKNSIQILTLYQERVMIKQESTNYPSFIKKKHHGTKKIT
jgi:hypothetical protein